MILTLISMRRPVSDLLGSAFRRRINLYMNRFLFNSKGVHIANFVSGQLHAPHGPNIGHFLPDKQIFIDMSGLYLGEVLLDDRLLFNKQSAHKSVNYGVLGNHGNIRNHGNPGIRSVIWIPGGFEDVSVDWKA